MNKVVWFFFWNEKVFLVLDASLCAQWINSSAVGAFGGLQTGKFPGDFLKSFLKFFSKFSGTFRNSLPENSPKISRMFPGPEA